MLSHNILERNPVYPLNISGMSKKTSTAFRKVVRRFKSFAVDHPVIDLDTTPKSPDGCTILYHFSFGKMVWDKSLEGKKKFLTPETETRIGLSVSKDLSIFLHRNEVPYGLAVYNFLISNPDEAPAEWEGLTVTFKGTILNYSDGLAYPALIFAEGKCIKSRSSLQISTCVSAGRGLL